MSIEYNEAKSKYTISQVKVDSQQKEIQQLKSHLESTNKDYEQLYSQFSSYRKEKVPKHIQYVHMQQMSVYLRNTRAHLLVSILHISSRC